jgi:hypothetical protein
MANKMRNAAKERRWREALKRFARSGLNVRAFCRRERVTEAAITYAQNQWTALNVYVTQGYLNIDNNAAERAMKRVAIGRKNWLFAGNDIAAASHARLWSLIASAERHGLDPQRYLTSVLAKIGQTPAAELDQFLPDVWKRDDAAEIDLGQSKKA